MATRLFQRNQGVADTDSPESDLASGSLIRILSRPAGMLVFLLAIVLAFLVVRQVSGSGGATMQLEGTQSPQPVELKSSTSTPVEAESGAPSSVLDHDNSSTSVSTEATVIDGKPRVEVEVNGEKIPVSQQGTSQHIVHGDGTNTVVDINIHGGQVSTSSTTTNASTNSSVQSFTHNVQSTTVTNTSP